MRSGVTSDALLRRPSALRYSRKPQVLISAVVTQRTTTWSPSRVAVKLASAIAVGLLTGRIVGSPGADVPGLLVNTLVTEFALTTAWLLTWVTPAGSGLSIVTWKAIAAVAPAWICPLSAPGELSG